MMYMSPSRSQTVLVSLLQNLKEIRNLQRRILSQVCAVHTILHLHNAVVKVSGDLHRLLAVQAQDYCWIALPDRPCLCRNATSGCLGAAAWPLLDLQALQAPAELPLDWLHACQQPQRQ